MSVPGRKSPISSSAGMGLRSVQPENSTNTGASSNVSAHTLCSSNEVEFSTTGTKSSVGNFSKRGYVIICGVFLVLGAMVGTFWVETENIITSPGSDGGLRLTMDEPAPKSPTSLTTVRSDGSVSEDSGYLSDAVTELNFQTQDISEKFRNEFPVLDVTNANDLGPDDTEKII